MCYETQMPLIFGMYFREIGQCFQLVIKKIVLEIQNPFPLGSTTLIYQIFNKYSRPIHKLCKQERRNRQTTIIEDDDDRQNSRITDRQTFHLKRVYIWSIWF